MAQDVGFKKTATAEVQYTTGAQRDSRTGKGAFHWMPWDAVWLVSNIYERGNKGRSKFLNGQPVEPGTGDGNDRNWEAGMPLGDLLQSAMNHITAHVSGDRSEAHISQAIWNLLNYLQISIWVTLGFRPKSLNTLANHRGDWKYGDEPPSPLSPQEIEWLKFKGVIPNENQMKPGAPPLVDGTKPGVLAATK
jgi:hypothetical protein